MSVLVLTHNFTQNHRKCNVPYFIKIKAHKDANQVFPYVVGIVKMDNSAVGSLGGHCCHITFASIITVSD